MVRCCGNAAGNFEPERLPLQSCCWICWIDGSLYEKKSFTNIVSEKSQLWISVMLKGRWKTKWVQVELPFSFPKRLLMCHRTTPSKCSRSASSPKRRQPLTWQDCGLVIDGFIPKPCINHWQPGAVHENLPNNMCITEIVTATKASFDNFLIKTDRHLQQAGIVIFDLNPARLMMASCQEKSFWNIFKT